MKKEYKETFNQIEIGKGAVKDILALAKDPHDRRYQNKRGGIRKLTVVLTAVALTVALAIPVMAIDGFDFVGVFRGLFGDTAEIVQETGAYPEVTVLENTFEDLDVHITGIAGDENLIYIMLDVTRKDGKGFSDKWTEKCGFGTVLLELQQANEIRNAGPGASGQMQGKDRIGYIQATSENWVALTDTASANTKTLAYIVDLKTEIEGQAYNIPGETYILELRDFSDPTSSLDSSGVWKAEFVPDYQPPKKITRDVHQPVHLPDWGTTDSFTYGFTLGSFELTPFALRYHCDDYDAYDNAIMNDAWNCLYLEMKDGSTVGDKTFEDLIQRLTDETPRFLTVYGDMKLDGEVVQENSARWIFNQPIDLTQVKAVHFGDLTIPISEND